MRCIPAHRFKRLFFKKQIRPIAQMVPTQRHARAAYTRKIQHVERFKML